MKYVVGILALIWIYSSVTARAIPSHEENKDNDDDMSKSNINDRRTTYNPNLGMYYEKETKMR